jgi:hypothetical protein
MAIADTEAGRTAVNAYCSLAPLGVPPLGTISLEDCYVISWILYDTSGATPAGGVGEYYQMVIGVGIGIPL